MVERKSDRYSIAVIIASTGRPEILDDTLNVLFRGDRLPDETIVSIVQDHDLPEDSINRTRAAVHVSPKGLCKQRNYGLKMLKRKHDIVAFIDDDVFVHEMYLEELIQNFANNPDMVLIMGHLLQNGDISANEAKFLLNSNDFSRNGCITTSAKWGGVYGANMAFRASFFAEHGFDERLPLYSYMEDVDIGTLARRSGQVGYSFDAVCVHLRTPSGRVNHRRLGYSEVVNPVYLGSKGTIPMRVAIFRHCLKIPTANFVKGVLMGDQSRAERLMGNLLAYSKIIRGQILPEFIEEI